MRVTLTLTTGPQKGLAFSFAGHDTFLVGRSRSAHFRPPRSDKAFSRLHFMVEVNPPDCRLIDLGSRNGTFLNGERILSADLHDGDEIRAGHTVLSVKVEPDDVALTMVYFPEPAESAFMPEIPGYIPLRPLGGGSLGKLFLATSSPRDELRVVRIIRARQPGTRPHGDEFLEAARTLLELRHPRIARLHDLGAGKNFFYFAYEYAAGREVAEVLAHEGPLAPQRVLGWFDQLLDALDHAHDRDIVLRDVQPRKVRIGGEPGRETAVWTEFGLERIYSASPLSGLSGLHNLTEQAPFLPPEFLTDYKHPAPPGDQYAAAALLYHLLTGSHVIELPKGKHQRFSVLTKQAIIPLRERRPELSAELAQVVERALSRQIEKRFPDIAAFRAALAALS